MNVGDLIQLTACGKLFDQRTCNVFYYVVAAWTGNITPEEAVSGVITFTWENVLTSITDAWQMEEVRYANLTDPSQDATYTNTIQGSETVNEALSPFDAASIRLFGADSTTRSGYKRVAGLTEGGVENGGQLTSAVKSVFQLMADRMATQYDDDGSDDVVLDPVIVGRTPGGLLDPSRVNPIVRATAADFKTTQNTRKRGRGV